VPRAPQFARRENQTALILNPSLSDSQILRAITDEFRLQPAKTTKKDLYDSINGFLLRELAANHNVALIVDEAQNLKPSVLEQIRLLSNLETRRRSSCRSSSSASPSWRRSSTATACASSNSVFHCVIMSRRSLRGSRRIHRPPPARGGRRWADPMGARNVDIYLLLLPRHSAPDQCAVRQGAAGWLYRRDFCHRRADIRLHRDYLASVERSSRQCDGALE